MIETFAPAKINLYLHVTGRRADGYHFLDSLVAFTNIGDKVRLEPADSFSFEIEGPMAAALRGQDPESNLAVRAVRLLASELNKPMKGKLTLTKNLPIASGIGGGSTDAAAALRLFATREGMPPDAALLHSIASSLGQDIPCCLAAQTCYFRDIGNVTDPGPELPLTHIVLVNPNQSLPTPSVYKARTGGFSASAQLEAVPQTTHELVEMLTARSNDLTQAAMSLCPVIGDVLTVIAGQPDCLLSRMSGSGATCFGLFADRSSAKIAAMALYSAYPDWWIAQAFIPAPLARLP
ncbi:MAG: 4-(cytidine 5'-diphospho)-2-C-methyl-D-erythritol kinase [Alphaproteobacteria bacterium]|nr:4-(cytidine 5'-diphospho)-2-C-methyl-D-erythritol kinase [Alphaproteobacteria bacterium]